MSIKRKICVVTGTRAEYGLLYWLMKEIKQVVDMELQLIVTGMHLSYEFGLTYKQIEADGFNIDYKVEILLSSDTPVGINKSMGLAMIGFADAYMELQPDIVVVLGDRFEVFSATSAATIARIPIAHLHGGETTEGAVDEAFRHSITKMSYLHFTTTESYRKRVIQLGEHPDRVYNVGAPGVEYIHRMPLLDRSEVEKSIGFELGSRNLLVTFHSVTLENATAEKQFGNLLQVLDELIDTKIIFTKANADTDGRVINDMIDKFVMMRPEKACAHTSLGQIRYLSTMQYMDAVVGNSSSGLIEVPSFSIGTINIGDRQRGRVRATSVIDCEPTIDDIKKAFKTLYSKLFQEKLSTVKNPHGSGSVSKKVLEILRHQNLSEILKKKFYDI
jgi:GDP/UDP-N,N'-diacetylbacillosamine 2-epimerase (hydrolysing)